MKAYVILTIIALSMCIQQDTSSLSNIDEINQLSIYLKARIEFDEKRSLILIIEYMVISLLHLKL